MDADGTADVGPRMLDRGWTRMDANGREWDRGWTRMDANGTADGREWTPMKANDERPGAFVYRAAVDRLATCRDHSFRRHPLAPLAGRGCPNDGPRGEGEAESWQAEAFRVGRGVSGRARRPAEPPNVMRNGLAGSAGGVALPTALRVHLRLLTHWPTGALSTSLGACRLPPSASPSRRGSAMAAWWRTSCERPLDLMGGNRGP
jgi:hypothetical protein